VSGQYISLVIRNSFVSFRGPAPLQHTILSGAKKTGVTLQTLDDKSFDHGIILAQTPAPFLLIPNWDHCTYNELLEFVSPKAASMLIHGLRDQVFVPPLINVGLSTTENQDIFPGQYTKKHASKITPEDKKILLLEWDGHRICRQYRAVGRVWTNIWIDAKTTKRLIFDDVTLVDKSAVISDWIEHWNNKCQKIDTEKKEEAIDVAAIRFIVPSKANGPRQPLLYVEDGDAIIFNAVNSAIRIGSITVEGHGKKPASKALRNIHRQGVWRLISTAPEYAWRRTRKLLVEPAEADGIEGEGPDLRKGG
jgi:methionyl-tRNA formyltransferase